MGLSNWDRLALIMQAGSQQWGWQLISSWLLILQRVVLLIDINMTMLQLPPSDVFPGVVTSSVTFHLSEVIAVAFYLQPHHSTEIFPHYVHYWRGKNNISSTSNSHSLILSLQNTLIYYNSNTSVLISIHCILSIMCSNDMVVAQVLLLISMKYH